MNTIVPPPNFTEYSVGNEFFEFSVIPTEFNNLDQSEQLTTRIDQLATISMVIKEQMDGRSYCRVITICNHISDPITTGTNRFDCNDITDFLLWHQTDRRKGFQFINSYSWLYR